ncbi:MAG: hypothetical protein COU69_02660 [Candidatus Pacebacteria bacterium CG10_big_fil_rev_8_21_14_0_10_56_10]|nr:MAG: hypothetical protein COU69_02660 [Candidatus Pacebacteria bacterium CG10_big_fil_rev_8_21_14_0_10_56_10]
MRHLSNRFSNRLSNRFNNRVSSSPGNSFGSFKLLPWLGALTGAVILTACSPQSSQTDQPFHAGSVVNRNTDSQPAGNQGTPATGQDQDQAGRLPQPKPSADNANTSPAQLSLGEKQAVLVKNFSHIGALRGRDTEAIGLASAVFKNDHYQLLAVAEGLGPPPAGQVYQGWLQRSDAPGLLSTGGFETEDGVRTNTFVSPTNLLGYTRYLVTLEPTGEPTDETTGVGTPQTATRSAGTTILQGSLTPISR